MGEALGNNASSCHTVYMSQQAARYQAKPLYSGVIQPRYPTTSVDGKSRSMTKEWRGKVDGFRRNALEVGQLKTRPDQGVARLPRHKTLRSSICQALFRS
jgi:hypothetical protein